MKRIADKQMPLVFVFQILTDAKMAQDDRFVHSCSTRFWHGKRGVDILGISHFCRNNVLSSAEITDLFVKRLSYYARFHDQRTVDLKNYREKLISQIFVQVAYKNGKC